MSVGNFVSTVAGDPTEAPAWMEWAVWPFLLLVVLLTRGRRGSGR